jgi:hypothetical protein
MDEGEKEFRELTRRDFMRDVAAMAAATRAMRFERSDPQFGAAKEFDPNRPLNAPEEFFIGIQMGPHSLFDEGFDQCLDFIQMTADVNAVLVYSQTYLNEAQRPLETLAQDHGALVKDLRGRKLPFIWTRPREGYYGNTVLRYASPDKDAEFANRDLFVELLDPVRRRGIKLYARILEVTGPMAMRGIVNFEKVLAVDVYGKPLGFPCWNNPDYKNWWPAVAEDLFRSYELDGLQWGAERHGPLMVTILNGRAPFCFCEFCQARCQGQGISVERAREGFTELHRGVQAIEDGSRGPDGAFTGLLRVLLRYPEVLAWEYQYRLSREEMEQAIFSAAKKAKPTAQVGWHIDHQQTSWDQVYRAEMTYGEMAAYSDFIKPIVYHDILGPRIRWWYLDRLQKSALRQVSLEESLDFYYDTFDYDKKLEPALDQLDQTGFSPDYVFRETKRTVIETGGKAKVYPGIGFDIPWNGKHFPSDAGRVYQATRRAFAAGADGIVISREYDEMRRANLEAVGRAVTDELKERALRKKASAAGADGSEQAGFPV